jgi:hypothetical protein
MKENEPVRDMYSYLNLIVDGLNSIGLTKLEDADIMRKIFSMIPHEKYARVVTILHNKDDLSKMTPALVIGKLVAFEMS